MVTKFYMDGISDERERILKLIESKIKFLKDNYIQDSYEKHTVARLQNLHEQIKDTNCEVNVGEGVA